MSAPRKELKARIITTDGTAINVVLRDGLLPDDLIIQGMKAEGYRVMTGRDVFAAADRRVCDYLIRLKTIIG